MSRRRRVIKLGGSLLDWPELPSAFADWLSVQPPAANVVVVGGGTIVESLRTLDRAVSLGGEAAHWLAIRAMSLTAALAADLLSARSLAKTIEELQPSAGEALEVLDVEQFMRADAAGDDPLPCNWQVTSDSIAARVAAMLHAQELVLLKSTLPSEPKQSAALAERGYVDAYFPQAARMLSVRAVNLRDSAFPQTSL
jgi:aspartokinase-like uncharacterized kinase